MSTERGDAYEAEDSTVEAGARPEADERRGRRRRRLREIFPRSRGGLAGSPPGAGGRLLKL
jgi:hypothetical protein